MTNNFQDNKYQLCNNNNITLIINNYDNDDDNNNNINNNNCPRRVLAQRPKPEEAL